MRILDYFNMALGNISSAKLRSLLTSLGIIIGVGSVVLITTLSGGVSTTITGAFTDLGTTRLTISPSAPGDESTAPGPGGGDGNFGASIASTLTLQDAAALESVGGVDAVAPVVQLAARIEGPAQMLTLAVTGTSPQYGQTSGQTLLEGRSFTANSAEVVINEAAASALFGESASLGQQISINDALYTVVGLFANQESAFAPPGRGAASVLPAVYIPVEPAMILAKAETVAQIIVTASSPEVVEQVRDSIRTLLLERHGGVADFGVTSTEQLLSSFTQVFDTLSLFLAAIAGISLVVGGIGIMNIMLVTVSERTREIGIAKAIGATRSNVVVQFLTEAVVLSLIGGALGLLVAWLGATALGSLFDLPTQLSLEAILIALGVSAGIGIIFGVLPAWRAARLDPIIALRHE